MPPKKKTEAAGSLQSVLSKLRTKDELEIGAFEGFNMRAEGMTTGNLSLDALTGIGGFPRGRVTELVGPPSSGKTTAALQTAAKAQQAGHIVAFFDFERSLDPVYCKALGLDVHAETFLYSQPKYFEQGANAFREMVATGEVYLGIFDSVATMVTKHELEAETGAVQVADRAKMMHQYLRQLNPLLADFNTGAIFLNHVMDLVDATPMGRRMAMQGIKRKTSPGGKALPFYASLRIEFKQIGNLKSAEMDLLNNEVVDQIRQTKTDATVVKNKAGGDPFRTTELRVRFGKGFSQPFSVLTVLTSHKRIKRAGAWFTFPPELRLDKDDDNSKLQGEDNVLSLMEANPEWFALLEAEAKKIVDSLGTDLFEQVDEAETEFSFSEDAVDKETGEIHE